MILSPEATEAEAADTVSRISGMITDGGGNIAKQDNWGVRRLAYPIQRFIEGNYFITRCTMEAQAAVELNTTLNSSQDVLRYLVFRLEKSELAAIEVQAERERGARQQAEARAAAERAARERDEARRAAEAQAAAMAAEAAAAEATAASAAEGAAAEQQDTSDSTADEASSAEPAAAEGSVEVTDQEEPATPDESDESQAG
jgi:small subunit ribosomal protein S6